MRCRIAGGMSARVCLNSAEVMKDNARFGLWLTLSLAIAVIDQLTKWLVINSELAESPFDITPFLRLIYTENTGAAFGILADQGDWALWLLSGFSALACLFIGVWLWKKPPTADSLALSLVLGGAMGNFIDRVQFGYVVDFIDAYVGVYHWPTFNIADSAITLGATVLFWRLLFDFSPKAESQKTPV